ncbi:PREDICTED: uncharacterized protein LOC104811052 [Tarenaya hassleriana]|uniref:uncharacterized protein LOC104811052 n=1 Tax=Tarenaya hassleriana TaxID=28532 RepID=UPI00053C34A5|nr:PREDICTED: uncharacterized protein LOC104811052 [Tarenaya hassleriana]XP_010535896.1 PREDICTED: uncharacterized protein LOC104811052 [Tarenaya hassleriana]XP_010535897.1 PREDICTED: uncharacterized protein LOC104811052 [Tarenaya hassleriana]
MNDQSKLMNPPPPQQMMGQPPPQMMNLPPPPQVMNQVQSQIMNQTQLLGQSQGMNHPVMGMNQPQVMNLVQSQAMMNLPLMMNTRNFNPNPSLSTKYQNPASSKPNNFGPALKKQKMNRSHWKGKNIPNDKRPMKEPIRRMDNLMPNHGIAIGPGGMGGYNPQQVPGSGIQVGPVGAGGYNPPTLNELQSQNRLKTRKFYPKRKFNNNRYIPYAPRNTTSFIIRAKKSGGIAELVSPCPVTPAVLPTPMFSPSREVLGDMAKEEWGVDGYGSMKGLIRLRSDGHDLEPHYDDDEDEGGSSESDVEEHVEVERRLDHDLSRFEMIYPSYGGSEYHNVLENRVDDQDTHIAQLEEENLTLKERLFLMERELGDLRRRLQFLERRNMVATDANEEVVENESENDSETGGSDARTSGDTKENHHADAEDVLGVARDDATVKDVSKNKRKVDETRDKPMVGLEISGENNSEVKELAGKYSGGDVDVAEKHGNELKPEGIGMNHSGGEEMVSEKLEDLAENDFVKEQ